MHYFFDIVGVHDFFIASLDGHSSIFHDDNTITEVQIVNCVCYQDTRLAFKLILKDMLKNLLLNV